MLQIIDFGESVNVSDPKKKYNDFVGTIHYLPPESQEPRTGADLKKCDLWCLGVIAYILVWCLLPAHFAQATTEIVYCMVIYCMIQLFGTPPFKGDSQQAIFQNISSGKLTYPSGKQTISCKKFISRLLCDKDTRMTADEALQHAFIHGNGASRSNLKAGCSSYVASLEVL